jgi:hypothetical protein
MEDDFGEPREPREPLERREPREPPERTLAEGAAPTAEVRETVSVYRLGARRREDAATPVFETFTTVRETLC